MLFARSASNYANFDAEGEIQNLKKAYSWPSGVVGGSTYM